MPDAQTIIDALLTQKTPVIFRAHGPSMYPAIRDGDDVGIRPCGVDPLPRGGVVLYRAHDRLVLHRLTAPPTRNTPAWAVADASLEGGEAVEARNILGMAKWVQRHGRTRRLDTWMARWRGLAWHWTRPARRAWARLRRTAAP